MSTLIIYVKTTLKSIFSNGAIAIIYFVSLPIIIGLLMGSFLNFQFENPINITKTPIAIVDEDNSTMSKNLSDMISSLDTLLTVESNESDADVTIVIPSGYEKSLLSNEENSITLKENNDSSIFLTTLETILNEYHKKLSIQLSNPNVDLSEIYNKSAVSSSVIGKPIVLNSNEYYAVSLIGFFVTMMIMNLAGGAYKSEELGINKRIYSIPLTRVRLMILDVVAGISYVFILFMIYLLVYRFLGISFTGSFPLLLLISVVTAIFIVSVSNLISTFLPKKYGTIATFAIFLVQIVLGGTFMPNTGGINISPAYFINKLFENYVLFNNFDSLKPFLISSIGISILLYSLALLKEKFSWRTSIWKY